MHSGKSLNKWKCVQCKEIWEDAENIRCCGESPSKTGLMGFPLESIISPMGMKDGSVVFEGNWFFHSFFIPLFMPQIRRNLSAQKMTNSETFSMMNNSPFDQVIRRLWYPSGRGNIITFVLFVTAPNKLNVRSKAWTIWMERNRGKRIKKAEWKTKKNNNDTTTAQWKPLFVYWRTIFILIILLGQIQQALKEEERLQDILSDFDRSSYQAAVKDASLGFNKATPLVYNSRDLNPFNHWSDNRRKNSLVKHDHTSWFYSSCWAPIRTHHCSFR